MTHKHRARRYRRPDDFPLILRIEAPQTIGFLDLAERVIEACRELDLPPINCYRVNGNSLAYCPADAIVRETSLPAPTRRDKNLDLAYLVRSLNMRPGGLIDVRAITLNGGQATTKDLFEGDGYFSVASVEINQWALDDELQQLFQRALKKRGLKPRQWLYEPWHDDSDVVYRVLTEYHKRTPRYTARCLAH